MKEEYDFSQAERGRFFREGAIHTHDNDRIRYAVVIEKAERNYSAYVPDLPGCVASADTIEDVEREIRAAIKLHLDGLRAAGVLPPKPTSVVEYVDA